MTPGRAIELGRLALRFGQVNRATLHEDGITPESDTTHTVMLGLVACAFATELPGYDVGRIAELVLVHDLVEVYAGDTNSFGITLEARAAKRERETRGLAQLVCDYGHEPWLMAALDEYEAQETPEARLVRYLDKALPKVCHVLNSHAAIKRMGKGLADLQAAHTDQLTELDREYPGQLAARDLLVELMANAECSWVNS